MKRWPSSILGVVIILASFYGGWYWLGQDLQKIRKRVEGNIMGSNHLANEKSPYLLQHKDNPVHWYPWGEEAFQAARDQKKLIFLSIGYSTCHWCHVMEHDSFEQQEVANLLNKHFISIKVDREERPDVDQIYMSAVVAMTGHGGWPMSVFITPELKPVWGGTFFWKDQFTKILEWMNGMWEKEPDRFYRAADELVAQLQQTAPAGPQAKLGVDDLKRAYSFYRNSFDEVHGGFGGAPKFPKSFDLSFLLRVYKRTGDTQALHMVTHTLDQMARGGIYDHLGGGFARYSTDVKWLVPHFEKMLYDNAQLAWTFLEAHQATGNQMYASVARETLDYVLRDMTHGDGGFYSAEDADSEGEEGKFYVWTEKELKAALTDGEFNAFRRVYLITDQGNFEHGTNILSLAPSAQWSDKETPLLKSASEKLFRIREKRIHPYKDDKILTDWNGLMIAAMAKGHQVLGDERYLNAAQKAAGFIEKNLYQEGKLLRRYRDGEGRFDGLAQDYAYLIFGLLQLHQTDFDSRWFQWAENLQKTQDTLFWDGKDGGYFTSAENAPDLIVRDKEWTDGAMPSANSVSLYNLLHWQGLAGSGEGRDKIQKLLTAYASPFNRYPGGFGMMLMGLDYETDKAKEVVIVGPSDDPARRSMIDFLFRGFLPNKIVAVGEGQDHNNKIPLLKNRRPIEGKTAVYICIDSVCERPLTDFEEAKKSINQVQPYSLE